jgi:hydrogenase maturation protease
MILTIIGCGNPLRADDGVGVWLAQRLQDYLAQNPNPNVKIYDCGTAAIDIVHLALGSDRLILMDASIPGTQPGAIQERSGAQLHLSPASSYNLHEFRWHHAIATGRQLYPDQFPEAITVYLIEALSLDFGASLSAVVRQASEQLLGRLLEVIATVPDPGA